MKSIAEIEHELKHLRRRVRELEGNPDSENEAAVAELTQETEEISRSAGRGGWATAAQEACEKARESGARTRAYLRAQTGRDNG